MTFSLLIIEISTKHNKNEKFIENGIICCDKYCRSRM